MAASVTYDNVQSSEGGNIFRGVKFWVAHRVPMRSDITDKIRGNGGELVPLEKNADILIADHARKDAPPGSYSWKFITESVANGIVQLKDRYLIGRHPDHPRPVGAGGVVKTTRTPFTKEDDAMLAKWVLAQPNYQTGNKIFQDYENMNPRHTWQSWRNRWVKTLQHLSTANLERIAASVPDEPVRNAQTIPQPTQPISQPPPQPSTRKSTQTPIRSPTSAPVRKAVPREEPSRPSQVAESHPPVPPSLLHPIVEKQMHQPKNKTPERGSQPRQDQPPGERRQPTPPLEQSPVPITQLNERDDETEMMKAEFYTDIDMYNDVRGLDIKPQHMINGNAVELWDLHRAVSVQEVAPSEVDWFEVAMTLGFKDDHDITLKQLQQCYEDNLLEFLEAMDAFAERHEDDEDIIPEPSTQQEQNDVALPTQQETLDSPASYVPSSPPVDFAGAKRAFPYRTFSSSGPSKRRRFSRNREIPSTPEEKIGVIRDHPSTQNLSPSIRRNLMRQEYLDFSEASQQLPPLPDPMSEMEEERADEEEYEEDEQEAQEKTPVPAAEEQPPSDFQVQEGPDITPSQQLRSELDPRPIPFTLQMSRQTEEPRSSRPLRSEKQPEPSTRRRIIESVGAFSSSAKPIPRNPPRRTLPPSFTFTVPTSTPLRKLPGALPPRQPTTSNKREISDWMAYYQSLGFAHHVVVEGLKRTTMTPGKLAELVMQSIRDGRSIPSHHEGIWTDRDDDELKMLDDVVRLKTNSKARRKAKRAKDRLLHKHGRSRIDLRRAFLDAEAADVRNRSGS